MAVAALAAIPTVLGMLGSVSGLIPSLSRWSQYGINNMWSNQIPDAYILLAMVWRKWITEETFYESMKKLGYDKYWSEGMYLATQERPNIYEYITLWRRGKIDRMSLDYEAEKLGVNGEMLELFKQVTEYFPTPAELIRYAIREVYTPEVVKEYGMMEAIPEDFLKEAEKAGLPIDQAKNAWAAHWTLPSPGQGFEMMQRGVINPQQLMVLLRTLDIMPYWRDKLTQIAYRPYSRVDVRRMYATNTLDRDGVKRAYLDLGYDDEKAEKMTEFTIAYETDEMQGLSRANIINAYKKSIITREQLSEYLFELGYNANVTEFWLAMADYEKTSEELKEFEGDIIELFKLGDADISSIRQQLYDQNLPAVYVNDLIQKLQNRKGIRRKVASKEDMDIWLAEGIITQVQYAERLRLMGYRDDDIQNYLTQIILKSESEELNFLGIATYKQWLKDGIMTKEEFINTLTAMGRIPQDITRFITQAEKESGLKF